MTDEYWDWKSIPLNLVELETKKEQSDNHATIKSKNSDHFITDHKGVKRFNLLGFQELLNDRSDKGINAQKDFLYEAVKKIGKGEVDILDYDILIAAHIKADEALVARGRFPTSVAHATLIYGKYSQKGKEWIDKFLETDEFLKLKGELNKELAWAYPTEEIVKSALELIKGRAANIKGSGDPNVSSFGLNQDDILDCYISLIGYLSEWKQVQKAWEISIQNLLGFEFYAKLSVNGRKRVTEFFKRMNPSAYNEIKENLLDAHDKMLEMGFGKMVGGLDKGN